MAGLLDFIAGSNDPSTADPNTGLVEAQRRQLAYGILGQTGAALLAAGAPHMPGQEAPYLAQLGQIPGNVAQQQAQMAQTNTMAQRAQVLRQKVEQEKAAQAYIQSPEYAQQLEALPAVLKAQAMANIKAGDYGAATKIVSDYVQLQIQAQREKAALENAPPTVTHDQSGNPWAYDRKTRTWSPLQIGQDPSAAYGLGPSSGAASPGAPRALPDGTPITDTAAPSANPYPNASIPAHLPYDKAFGFRGGAAYGQGAVQEFAFPGSSSAPLALENAAIAQFDKFRTELAAQARADAPGSSRLKALASSINETLPVAGNIFTNPKTALDKLSAAKDSLAKELQHTTQLFQAPATPRAEKAKLAADILSLRTNLDNTSIIIDKLNGRLGGSGPTQSQNSNIPPPADYDPTKYDYRLKPDGSGWQRRPK